jgi:hypothetical protein
MLKQESTQMVGMMALEFSHSLPTAVFTSNPSDHINLHKVHITSKDAHHQHLCKIKYTDCWKELRAVWLREIVAV